MIEKKLFGVFPHDVLKKEDLLLKGIRDGFMVPHSRYIEIRKEDILQKGQGLEVLSESKEGSIYIVASQDKKEIYITGHPEYGAYTLKEEYERDLGRGVGISMPANYFKEDHPEKEPVISWKASGEILYSNWIQEYLYQKK